MSEFGKAVSESLKNKNEWNPDPFGVDDSFIDHHDDIMMLVNRKEKIALWVGNGPFFFDMLAYNSYANEDFLEEMNAFGIFEKFWLYYKMRFTIYKHMKHLKKFKKDLWNL